MMKPSIRLNFTLFFFLICTVSGWSQTDTAFVPQKGLEINASLLSPLYYRGGRAEVLLRHSFAERINGPRRFRKAVRLGIASLYNYEEDTYVYINPFTTGASTRNQSFSLSTGWEVAIGLERQRVMFDNRIRFNTGIDLLGRYTSGKTLRRVDTSFSDGTPTTTKITYTKTEAQRYGVRSVLGFAYFPFQWLSVGMEADLSFNISWSSYQSVAVYPQEEPRKDSLFEVDGGVPRLLYIGVHF